MKPKLGINSGRKDMVSHLRQYLYELNKYGPTVMGQLRELELLDAINASALGLRRSLSAQVLTPRDSSRHTVDGRH